MLIVRGDAQTLPSELNKAATGEVWFDRSFPKLTGWTSALSCSHRTDGRSGISMSTGSCFRSRLATGLCVSKARPHSACAPATQHGSGPTSGTGTAPPPAR